MARKAAVADSVLDLPVIFGQVSIGDKKARIGVTIERSKDGLTIAKADKTLCERRLTGTIIARPSDENEDQGHFEGMEADLTLEGIFDVKGVSFTSDSVSIGLTFALGGLDVAALAHFAKRAGRLVVAEVEDLPDADKGNGESEE